MPIVTKLENYSAHEALYREMVVMGLKYISRGESPRNITDQLIANLPPKLQDDIIKKFPNSNFDKQGNRPILTIITDFQNNQNNIYESTLKHCSPKVNVKEPNKRSCFDDEVLLSLIKSWNNTNKHDKININKKNIDYEDNKILNQIIQICIIL